MIVDHSKSEAVNMSGAQSLAFGIEGSALVYKLMYSQMFQDKEKIVLQELAANAFDAHKSAGKAHIPIRIELPTELSPELVIEDEGIGMSYDTVCNVYPVYGKSSKSGSNADIGGFGYGGKSPFSISESYTVETTHQGITTTVACYLDNAFPKFSVFPTGNIGKPDGTIVRVPVSERQKQVTLVAKATKLFLLWDVKPTFTGASILYGTDLKIEETKYLQIYDTDIGIYGWNNGNRAIKKVAVGPYLYDIPDSMLDKLEQDSEYNFLSSVTNSPSKYSVVFKFEIGEIELSPSREWIENTEANLALLKKAVDHEVAIIRTTDTPIGIDWYTEIEQVIEKQGLWTSTLLPNIKHNVPIGIDAKYVQEKLKELRGTATSVLTTNYDSVYVWDQAVSAATKDLASSTRYAYTREEMPENQTEYLKSYYRYEVVNGKSEYRYFSAYTTLPATNKGLYNNALRSMLGINASSVAFKEVRTGRVKAVRNSYYSGKSFEMVSSHGYRKSHQIILHPEGAGKEVLAYLKKQKDGYVLIVQVDDITIGHIKTFMERYEEYKSDLDKEITVIFPDDVNAAYTAYREDLKEARKNVVRATTVKIADPVIGRLHKNIVDDTSEELTKTGLLTYDFKEDKQYVIARKLVKDRSEDYSRSIPYDMCKKYGDYVTDVELIVITDTSKTRTGWWEAFEKTVIDRDNVKFIEEAGYRSSELYDYIPNCKQAVAIDAWVELWSSYLSIFSNSGMGSLSEYLSKFHTVNYEYLQQRIGYYHRSTTASNELLKEIYSDALAMNAYTKIYASYQKSTFIFIDKISDEEKKAYLELVNKHLKIDS